MAGAKLQEKLGRNLVCIQVVQRLVAHSLLLCLLLQHVSSTRQLLLFELIHPLRLRVHGAHDVCLGAGVCGLLRRLRRSTRLVFLHAT